MLWQKRKSTTEYIPFRLKIYINKS